LKLSKLETIFEDYLLEENYFMSKDDVIDLNIKDFKNSSNQLFNS